MNEQFTKRRILVVEDNPAARQFFVRFLSQEGFVVIEAGTSVEAIQTFKTGAFHVIVTDIDLGKGPSGLWLGVTLRQLDQKLKIIFVSGDPSNRDRINESKLGPFLQKPFETQELLGLINQ